jgi:hypothetical protein
MRLVFEAFTFLALVAGPLSSCATTTPPSRTTVLKADRAHRLTPKHLSETVRALIWERMQTHGDDMGMLFWSMILLDQEDTKRVSEFIANEPTFARPAAGDESTINAVLPEEFFQLQTAFAVKAKAMATLANAEPPNKAELARAFGDLAATCIACHSVYMEEPTDARESVRDEYQPTRPLRVRAAHAAEPASTR